MAFTFYKKDDREYAELADEIQREINQMETEFSCGREKFSSSTEHVRFRIFEPMSMDVVAVDQAAENDIPMALMAGLENLRINREERRRLLYINVADRKTYSGPELSVIRAALRSRIMDIMWESDRKTTPYLFYKVNDSQTYAQLAEQVHAAIIKTKYVLQSDTWGDKFKRRTVDFEFNIFVPMRRDVVAEKPAVDNGDNEQPAENLENDEPAVGNAGDDGPPVEEEGKKQPSTSDFKTEELAARMGKMDLKTPKEEEKLQNKPTLLFNLEGYGADATL
ncbi:unnamed protein product [Caenorhabditis nigoni]